MAHKTKALEKGRWYYVEANGTELWRGFATDSQAAYNNALEKLSAHAQAITQPVRVQVRRTQDHTALDSIVTVLYPEERVSDLVPHGSDMPQADRDAIERYRASNKRLAREQADANQFDRELNERMKAAARRAVAANKAKFIDKLFSGGAMFPAKDQDQIIDVPIPGDLPVTGDSIVFDHGLGQWLTGKEAMEAMKMFADPPSIPIDVKVDTKAFDEAAKQVKRSMYYGGLSPIETDRTITEEQANKLLAEGKIESYTILDNDVKTVWCDGKQYIMK